MRILFMTQVLPFPLDAGPKVRAYHVIRYLAEAGHDVHLLSFSRSGETDAMMKPLRRMCAAVHLEPLVRSRVKDLRDGVRSLFGAMPFLVQRDQINGMWQRLRRITGDRSFAALHLDQLWMAPYGMNSVLADMSVLDQHNAVFMVPRRMAEHEHNPIARALLRNEANKLEAFERDACGRFDRVVWVSEEDRRAVAAPGAVASQRESVIPIATDPEMYPRLHRERPFRVTFLGGLHWPPNSEGISWFVKHVWPKVLGATPSAVLTVIGKGGRQVPALRGARQVDATGYVADLRRYLSETAVFVVPLRSGAGMRVKILDAWCWGLPIVSTTVGAEGMRAEDHENIMIADEPAAFADAVIDVFKNGHVARRLSDNGRSTVETHYDWKTVYQAWDQVYRG